MVEARYWRKLEDGRIACELCPRACRIPEGGRGACRGRVNRGGVLYADNFAQCVSVSMDPIEKKPLHHVCPGRQVLSIACNNCNLECDWCQNYAISQETVRTREIAPQKIVALALESDSFGIAYTYTEPLVWFEYLLAAGALAHEKGLLNILVTNGVLNEEPMKELLPHVDAMNIDLKSMRREFYTNYCHVDGAEAVQRTIEMAAKSCHIEVTNLVIPGLNDSREDIQALVDFVASIDPAIPLHFSRYFPAYKMTVDPTPVSTLTQAVEIAREKLHYVYLGNVGLVGEDTNCPKCGNLLVKRVGYSTEVVGVEDGRCGRCGRPADFLWCEA